MPTAVSELTAKDFRKPLLTVLGTLTKLTTTASIPFEKTYAPIFAMLGIEATEDLEKRIIWCFSDLKTKGFGHSTGRGKWSLTHQGVEEARALQGTTAEEDEVEAALREDFTPKQVVYAGYHADPYITSLALGSHSCLGFYTDRSATCAECPARVDCVQAMLAKLQGLASILNQEDEAEEQRVAANMARVAAVAATPPDPVPMDQQDTPIVTPTGPIRKDSKAKVTTMVCSAEAPCAKCTGIIQVGSDSYWVRGTGASKMYHKECYELG